MKLSEWAKKQGVSYRTALRWFHGGTLPVEAEQMTEVLTSFCARLYGKRAARCKAEKAIKATEDE